MSCQPCGTCRGPDWWWRSWTIARSYVSTESDNKQILSAAEAIEEAAHTLLRLKAGVERMIEDEVIEEDIKEEWRASRITTSVTARH